MNSASMASVSRRCAGGFVLLLAAGCGALQQAKPQSSSFYSLERAQGPAATPAPGGSPTLIVNPTRASAGFGSSRIIYVREAHKLEYFAHSEWVDPPARMLAPLIASAIEGSGALRAVVLTPSAAAGELRLDTEVVRLQHEFTSSPSRVRFTLRAHVVDSSTRKVLGWREFDESAPAASEDPRGGVDAANLAVQAVLAKLSGFCAELAGSWKPSGAR